MAKRRQSEMSALTPTANGTHNDAEANVSELQYFSLLTEYIVVHKQMYTYIVCARVVVCQWSIRLFI